MRVIERDNRTIDNNILTELINNKIKFNISGRGIIIINKPQDISFLWGMIDNNDIAVNDDEYYIRLVSKRYSRIVDREPIPLWIILARRNKIGITNRFHQLRTQEQINRSNQIKGCNGRFNCVDCLHINCKFTCPICRQHPIVSNNQCAWCLSGYTKHIKHEEVTHKPNMIGLIDYCRENNINISEDKFAWYIDKSYIIPEKFGVKYRTNDFYHVIRKG